MYNTSWAKLAGMVSGGATRATMGRAGRRRRPLDARLGKKAYRKEGSALPWKA